MRHSLLALVTLTLLLGSLTAQRLIDNHSFDSAGVRIQYVEKGEGEPVVLIHGFSRDLDLTWRDTGIFDALAKTHRVIAIDCRGHGRSERPKGANAYGAEMVDDVVRLLDHLDLESAHIVGYSMGGRIALKLAASHPHRARSVTLIGAGATRPNDSHRLWDELEASLEGGEGIRPLIEKIFGGAAGGVSESQIAAINEETLSRNDPRDLAAVARQYRDFATTERELERLVMPVAAIVGATDGFRPSVTRLHELKPDVQIVEIEGADHLSVLHRHETVDAIESVLAGKATEHEIAPTSALPALEPESAGAAFER